MKDLQIDTRVIEKKAYLSQKELKTVTVSWQIEAIEDWAFAYCDSLQKIILPHKEISFGRDTFLGCKELEEIFLFSGEDGESVVEPHLFATAVTRLDAGYLLNTVEAGSEEWYNKLDARITAILDASDMDGFSKQVLCGEEDYESIDQEKYIEESKKKKARLALIRLKYDEGLGELLRRKLTEYLLDCVKGQPSEAAWKVLLEDYHQNKEMIQLYLDLGGVTKDNKSDCLKDIGERFPEMKVLLLKHGENEIEENDFFADLEL